MLIPTNNISGFGVINLPIYF